MLHCVARILDPLLRLLFPATGCRRSTDDRQTPTAPPPGHLPRAVTSPSAPPPCEAVLPAEEVELVRPYLLAHEQRMEARRQRARRLELWLAVRGIDIGPRVIHGVKVAAS